MNTDTVKLIEVVGNSAVVQLPMRRFPGMVIQGDTLNALCESAEEIAAALKRNAYGEASEATGLLLASLREARAVYEAAVHRTGLPLPY